jgi:pyruvate dehydrogenase E2 component (dihydrolipoamide acetyltransferase)
LPAKDGLAGSGQEVSGWSEKAPETAAKSEGGAGAGVAAGAAAPAPDKAVPSKVNGDGRLFVSPLARRLAKENQLELSALTGSGPRGRIVQRDIEAALKSGTGKVASAPAAPGPATLPSGAPASAAALPQAMPDAQIRRMFEEGSYEVVPHDSMRKIIAKRLVEAKTTIPHFYLTTDCRIDKLLALRAEINAAAPIKKGEKGDAPAYKLSVNDMVIKALALALKAVPDANVTWTEAGMLKHSRADVGVAVSIPGGLITPVVRRADEKTLSAISNEMKSLAKRARERKLKPEEYQGGTTAVSNLGMFGVKDFAAVINPPHATILAVGAGEERAVVEKGQIIAANIMSATLSTDHRAVDGALGRNSWRRSSGSSRTRWACWFNENVNQSRRTEWLRSSARAIPCGMAAARTARACSIPRAGRSRIWATRPASGLARREGRTRRSFWPSRTPVASTWRWHSD